jgi:hypothetical protein
LSEEPLKEGLEEIPAEQKGGTFLDLIFCYIISNGNRDSNGKFDPKEEETLIPLKTLAGLPMAAYYIFVEF